LKYRNMAITATVAIMATAFALIALFLASLQNINPIGALAAIMVALAGIAWFRKTIKH